MLSLTVAASKFSKLPSDLLGIDDQEIAFCFNQECAETLYLFEQEQEVKRLEAMMTGTLLGQLNGHPKMNGEVREISPVNLGDQSW